MSVQHEEPPLRVPMSWEDYLELPEKPRAEWVDGVAVIMNVPPVWGHSDATSRLIALLFNAVSPPYHVGTDALMRLSPQRVRRPDLLVIEYPPEDGWVTEAPLMVAEVLSPSTRSEDLVTKLLEYAEDGIGQYWVVDAQARTVEVLRNVEGAWRDVVRLDDEHPRADVELGVVLVPVDIRRVFGN